MGTPASTLVGYPFHGQNVLRKVVDYSGVGAGAVGGHDVFTFTGLTQCTIYCYCTLTPDSLAHLAQISTGIAGAYTDYTTAQLVTGITTGTALNPGTGGNFASDNKFFLRFYVGTTAACIAVANGQTWGYAITVEATSVGKLEYICYWTPISSNGLIT